MQLRGHDDVYFKHVTIGTELDEHKDEGLPEPSGPLSKSVPMKAIELANGIICKAII